MPVFSTHLLDYEGLEVGRRIREHRIGRGQTLRDMAQRLGVSEAKLSNVERGKVSLDLEELARIAGALEQPLHAFLPRETVRHYFIRSRDDLARSAPIARELIGPEAGPASHHNPVWPLADPFVGKHMEPLIAEIRPLRDDEIHFISHDHEEFMFVLHGEVETRLRTNEGLVIENLKPGDSIYFRSNLPHCHRSTTSEAAESVNIIYSLRGAIDPDDGELSLAGRRFDRRGVYGDPVREAAAKIALLRRSRGLTLAELAREVRIGVRRLAEIEDGQKAPDLALLLRLARQFRRPLEHFFATTLDHQPYYFVQRGAGIPRLPTLERRSSPDRHRRRDVVYRPLASGFPDRGLHPFYLQLNAPDASRLVLHEHHGQEFLYVLAGEADLVTQVEKQEVVESLRAGDSVFLESSVPHLVRGRTRNPLASAVAELIIVFWNPLGETYLFTPSNAEAEPAQAGT